MANRMQHVHDALKVMRTTGEAWLTHDGERLRIRALRESDMEPQRADGPRPEGIFPDAAPCMVGMSTDCPAGWWFPYFKAFVKAVRKPGGVVYGDVWWHEGRLYCISPNLKSTLHGGDDIVMAIVVERHPRA